MALFVLATDVGRGHPSWAEVVAQAKAVADQVSPVLGFGAEVRAAPLDELEGEEVGDETFVVPACLDFGLLQRERLGQAVVALRRRGGAPVHHDDVDAGHPLVVDCLAGCARALAGGGSAGVVLAGWGQGDSGSRAQSYRLMRLVWEQGGFVRGEVGFVRHAAPFLGHVLERCAGTGEGWVMVAQSQWGSEHVEYARVMLENIQRAHPGASGWRMAEPPGGHPLLTAWYSQRILKLWNEKRAREAVRGISARRGEGTREARVWAVGSGRIGRWALPQVLEEVLPPGTPERVLVKVTWHGYATGTYTDPAALDALLSALPCRAVAIEGHSSSRNLGGAEFDWETEARANRVWIREQEGEYLRRTGLGEVLTRHRAEYVNVTEAWWDEDCPGDGVGYIPGVLRELAGCPLVSFAKLKGPTRLGVSNLFGLIPAPLRSGWHGANITHFAGVCCEVAAAYGALFPMVGLVEGLYSAVRWNRQGLYRSRWGNYDLTSDAGCVVGSTGLAAADILASRLQGQDVGRSGFFQVIRDRLGWDEGAAAGDLPEEIRALLC